MATKKKKTSTKKTSKTGKKKAPTKNQSDTLPLFADTGEEDETSHSVQPEESPTPVKISSQGKFDPSAVL